MDVKADWPPRALETVLGPSRGRYFGQGYRDVRHQLQGMSRSGDGTVTFSARISYPSGWSLDDKGVDRQPHLSTVDAVVLSLLALGRLGESGAARVSGVDLRAGGSPWTNVEEVPVQLSLQSIEPLIDGSTRKSFRALTGNIRATIETIGEWPQGPSVEPRDSEHSDDVGVYQSLY